MAKHIGVVRIVPQPAAIDVLGVPMAAGAAVTHGNPIVTDVSMGRVTHGDVLLGRASEEELVPFGGEQAHKAFALALGLQLVVDALAGDGLGAVLLVALPGHDPVPALRRRAHGIRLPGDAGPRTRPRPRRQPPAT